MIFSHLLTFSCFLPLLIVVLVTTHNIRQQHTEYITWLAMRVCSGGHFSFILFFIKYFQLLSGITCRIINVMLLRRITYLRLGIGRFIVFFIVSTETGSRPWLSNLI